MTPAETLRAAAARAREDEHDPQHAALVETYETTLGAVLTFTTGILLADLDDAWPLQDFILGYPLLTHERTDMFAPNATATERALLRQFPQLAEAHPPAIVGETYEQKKAACEAWVRSVSEHTGIPLNVTVTSAATTTDAGTCSGDNEGASA